MSKTVIVGMADLKVARNPDILTTLGLGSCVGIVLYDNVSKVGGLAHIMLPNVAAASDKSNKAKFADTAVDVLISEMMKIGGRKPNLVAKLAGGAHVFSTAQSSDILKVGARNAAMAKEVLRKLGIPIRSEDCGGNYGRTIELLTATGELRVKTIGHGVKTI